MDIRRPLPDPPAEPLTTLLVQLMRLRHSGGDRALPDPPHIVKQLEKWSVHLKELAHRCALNLRGEIGLQDRWPIAAYANALLVYEFGESGGYHHGSDDVAHLLTDPIGDSLVVAFPDSISAEHDARLIIEAVGWRHLVDATIVGPQPFFVAGDVNLDVIAGYYRAVEQFVRPAVEQFVNTFTFGDRQNSGDPQPDHGDPVVFRADGPFTLPVLQAFGLDRFPTREEAESLARCRPEHFATFTGARFVPYVIELAGALVFCFPADSDFPKTSEASDR